MPSVPREVVIILQLNYYFALLAYLAVIFSFRIIWFSLFFHC